MHINLKNIVICIIVIIIFSLSLNIVNNIINNNYIKRLVKSDSQEMLKGYIAYGDLNIVLNIYLDSIKNSEYNKLRDMSLFYAKMDNSGYDNLKSKISLANKYSINLLKVYVLDKDIYKCVFNVKSDEKVSAEYTICIKLDTDKKYFRVLDFTI